MKDIRNSDDLVLNFRSKLNLNLKNSKHKLNLTSILYILQLLLHNTTWVGISA
jgi:hypothetical protein